MSIHGVECKCVHAYVVVRVGGCARVVKGVRIKAQG